MNDLVDDEIICEFFGVVLTRKEFKKHLIEIRRAFENSNIGQCRIYNPVYDNDYKPSAETLYRDYIVRFEEMMAHILGDSGLTLVTVAPEINTEEDCIYGIFYGFVTYGKLRQDYTLPKQIADFWVEMVSRAKEIFPFINNEPRHHKIKLKDGKLMFWKPTSTDQESYEYSI